MRVHLADVGDPLAHDMFAIGRGGRFRSMRNTGSGGGGGTGGEGGDGGGTDDSDDTEDDADDTEDDKDSKDADKDKETDKDPELAKAIRRRDRALAENRRLKAQLAEKDKAKDDDKPDPTQAANSRLVRAEAKTQLAALGITDRDDQKAVLDVLRLDDIEVDGDGDVDVDAVEERISDLRRIFGVKEKETRRVPRTTSSRDKGGSGDKTSDPDRDRYRRIMGASR